jgi:hypothetical protein
MPALRTVAKRNPVASALRSPGSPHRHKAIPSGKVYRRNPKHKGA